MVRLYFGTFGEGHREQRERPSGGRCLRGRRWRIMTAGCSLVRVWTARGGTERCAGSSISKKNWPNFDNLLAQSCRFRAVRYTGGVDDAGAPGVGQGGNAVSETIRGRSVERGFDGKQIYAYEFGSH